MILPGKGRMWQIGRQGARGGGWAVGVGERARDSTPLEQRGRGGAGRARVVEVVVVGVVVVLKVGVEIVR